ncbi:unnamed protein product, partial [Staurois parvus]
IQDRRSGTGRSPYIQNKDRYRELYPVYRTGEVGLCRVHTYRIRTDTKDYTQHTGQEKWDCAGSIQDKISRIVQGPYRTGEVGLCRVHTGQEKWDCAGSIHTE